MIKKLYLFSISLLAISVQNLPSQEILWENNYGGSKDDEAKMIEQTNDGGYIIAGRSYSLDYDLPSYAGDVWICKINSNGGIVWDHRFGGLYVSDVESIKATSDGGSIFCGNISRDLGGGPAYYSMYFWVVKLDKFGNKDWERKLGGSVHAEAKSVIQTGDNGFLVTGYLRFSPVKLWVVKLDESGAVEWQKTFGETSESIPYLTAASIQLEDGSYLVAGESEQGDNYSDAVVLNLDPDGSIKWERYYGESETTEEIYSIIQISEGGFMFAGFSDNGDNLGHGEEDFWVLKTGTTGEVLWEQFYGGTADDRAQSVVQRSPNSFLLAGYSESIDYDIPGNYGSSDCILFGIDSTGAIQWGQNYGGADGESLNHLESTDQGTIMMAASTSSYDLDVSDKYNLADQSKTDIWIAELCLASSSSITEIFCGSYTTPSGNGTYTQPGIYKDTLVNSTGCDSIITINLTNEGYLNTEVYVENNVLQSAQFDGLYQWIKCTENGFEPIAGAIEQIFTADADGNYAVIVMKDGCSDTSECVAVDVATGISDSEKPESGIQIYPNPAGEQLTVEFGPNLSGSTLKMVDAQGRVLHRFWVPPQVPEKIIPLDIPAGAYFLIVNQDRQIHRFKLLKED